ncbi:hypothetical protein ACUHMQ_08595 [Chitinimonas sp. PSY-7]|uniref:hypothetical protein n=1 Tax=Chitinimonas sp. PSY-7 TaxID=3459088 RepID=UPI004040375E
MLPNVWSAERFKQESRKIFSRRSPQLQAIDRTLAAAHSFDPNSNAGARALRELTDAIKEWRRLKSLQGITSGRAQAEDRLDAQIISVIRSLHKRTSPPPTLKRVVPPEAPMPHTQPAINIVQPKAQPTASVEQARLLNYLADAMLDQHKKQMGYDDGDLFDGLDPHQIGRLTARWMLSVPDEVTDVPAARAEGLRVIAAMLGNDISVIKNLLEHNIQVVVIPRNKSLTVLEQFESLRGQTTFDGRRWSSVRGVSHVSGNSFSQLLATYSELKHMRDMSKGAGSVVAVDPSRGRIYVGITEENLLGGITSVASAECYAVGYSTSTHEFAHTIHTYGLTDNDRTTLNRAYKLRMQQSESTQWVDGPRKVRSA